MTLHREASEWWTIRPELLYCGCHSVLKFIELTRSWCSLTTPANKPSLTDAGWSFGNNTAWCVQCLHSEHAEGPWSSYRPELQHGGCHTVLKIMKLTRCWCSLTTHANKPFLTDIGWTFEMIQHMFNSYIVKHLKAFCWTIRPELLYCGCHTVLKHIKVTRWWSSLVIPANNPFLTDAGWTLGIKACVQCIHSDNSEGHLMNQ